MEGINSEVEQPLWMAGDVDPRVEDRHALSLLIKFLEDLDMLLKVLLLVLRDGHSRQHSNAASLVEV